MDARPDPAAVLQADGLTVCRGGRAVLDALDLAVPAGRVHALLGGNGAGKTTTLHAFLGFLVPDGGAALVGGVAAHRDADAARRQIAYLPEQVALYGHLSGHENLRYFAGLAGLRPGEAEARAWLESAGLAPEAHDRRAAGYSKGMRQKVGIAIALAKGARALVLDEPTSGLDPAAADELSAGLRAAAARGLAVLMATHDIPHALQCADRIGILHRGRLAADLAADGLAPGELLARYLDCTRAGGPAPVDPSRRAEPAPRQAAEPGA